VYAFQAVPGGYAAELEPAERTIISRVVADTSELLGVPIDQPSADDQPSAADQPSADDQPPADDAALAALAWQPADSSPPRDPALARLLPPASEDEELAAELRTLTEGSLRATKAEQLAVVHRGLTAPSRFVIVREGTERSWLAALTDVRLVLATRLGIENDEDAERIYARAGGEESQGEEPQSEEAELESALTSLYAALTWWQESLLEAMSQPAAEQ